MTAAAGRWLLAPGREIVLDRPRLIAVLNVTPDSFSDGGELDTEHRISQRAARFVQEGADALDIGGESTRPGASRVAAAEQIERVVPAIRAVRREVGDAVPITVDTTLDAVAEAALDAGADALNDVSAGEESGGDTIRLAARRKTGIALMHRVAPPDRDTYSDRFVSEPEFASDAEGIAPPVVVSVLEALRRHATHAAALGVQDEAICLDPGLGFGKSVRQNVQLMAHAGTFVALGFPVMFGASRKSFIGTLSGVEDAASRGPGSAGAACAMLSEGARLFRVHDVALHREALDAAFAVLTEAPLEGRPREPYTR